MQATHADCGGTTNEIEPPANVLLEAPSMSEDAASVYPSVGGAEPCRLLLVSLGGDPASRLDRWRRAGGLPAAAVALVTAESTRSGTASADGTAGTVGLPPGPDGTEGPSISTTTVTGPDDLTGIGIAIGSCLDAWANDTGPTHVCLDSVTTLVQYVGPRKAFQFLHVVTGRLTAAGALAHFHFDPSAHDGRTVATVESLFSDVFTLQEDTGTWSRVCG